MTKLKLKCGDIDIEYEGSEEFLKAELLKLIEEVAKLRGSGGDKNSRDLKEREFDAGGKGAISVSTAAQKLAVSSGSELIMAAAYALVSSDHETFTKVQLRSKAKEAKAYWKSGYRGNFDKYVSTLVKNGRLNHVSGDDYAMPSSERRSLGSRIQSSAAPQT